MYAGAPKLPELGACRPATSDSREGRKLRGSGVAPLWKDGSLRSILAALAEAFFFGGVDGEEVAGNRGGRGPDGPRPWTAVAPGRDPDRRGDLPHARAGARGGRVHRGRCARGSSPSQ